MAIYVHVQDINITEPH